MIAVTLSVFALFAFAWRTARSATPPDDGRAEVMKLEEERNQALQTGDIATLERATMMLVAVVEWSSLSFWVVPVQHGPRTTVAVSAG